jgi:hypothetical protein
MRRGKDPSSCPRRLVKAPLALHGLPPWRIADPPRRRKPQLLVDAPRAPRGKTCLIPAGKGADINDGGRTRGADSHCPTTVVGRMAPEHEPKFANGDPAKPAKRRSPIMPIIISLFAPDVSPTSFDSRSPTSDDGSRYSNTASRVRECPARYDVAHWAIDSSVEEC